jgi:tetratricopeptide (TPR) repeat protein
MRKRLVLLALFTVAVGSVLAGCSREREIPQPLHPSLAWSATLEEAQMEAQKTGDRILVSFEAYWCPWSRLLRESLYVNQAVVDSLAGFKCVSLDADRDTIACAEYDIRLYPTIIVMDAYGGEIDRMVGYHSPDEFLRRLSSMKLRDALVSEMFSREERSAGDVRFLMDFADLLRNVGTYRAALLRYERAAGLDKDNRLGIFEEASYAMAECNLLAGEYAEAGDRFRYFASSNPVSERCSEGVMLGALCYERAKERRAAIEMLETYLRGPDGQFDGFAAERLRKLRADGGR